MKTKLFLVLGRAVGYYGITSYAERLDNISIVEDVKCYQENESIYVRAKVNGYFRLYCGIQCGRSIKKC